MAEIDISDAATAGLKLVGRRPLSVLVWGLLLTGYTTLILVLFGGSLIGAITAMVKNGTAQPAPAQIFALIGSALGVVLLLWIGLIFLGAVVQGAAIRAELEPDDRSFAYLKFGRQELWLVGVNVVMGVVLWAAQMAMSIPLAILTIGMAAGSVGSANAHDASGFAAAMAGTIGIRLIGQLVIAAVTIWLWLRLCLGPVMSFRDRQFRLFESWNLTKGHAGRMFLAMLLVGLMLVVVYVAFWIILAAGIGFTVFANAGSAQSAQAFFSQPPDVWIGKLLPLLALLGLLTVVAVGVVTAMTWGSVARMYRQLNPDADVATTFA